MEINRLKLVMEGVIIAGLQHGLNKLPEPGFIAGWVIAIAGRDRTLLMKFEQTDRL